VWVHRRSAAASGLLYGFTEGAILERVHRRTVDHLQARQLGEESAGWVGPLKPAVTANCGQHGSAC